jgi:hypothetical protein
MTTQTITAILSHDGTADAGPVDFAGYVRRRLEADYPDARIEVQHGLVLHSRLVVDGEDDACGHDLLQGYWDDLCGTPDDPAWTTDPTED